MRDRFDKKWVHHESGCWLWTASTNEDGYGYFGVRQPDGSYRIRRAHRVSYEMNVGPIPKGLHVLHRCDNPSCVNPAHLWLGTNADNVRDREAKGRNVNRRGEAHGLTTITADDVRSIRARYAAGGVSQQAIADELGVNQTTVSAIIRRKTWGHIT